jgi:serine/threonine-protein kinase
VAALGAALASAPMWLRTRGPAPAPRRLILTIPEGQSLFRGYGSSLVMSPGGSLIAYVTSRQGVRRLYLHYLDQWTGTVLVEGPDDTTGPYQPFFSPDGEWVGYVTRTELKKLPVRGGTPITLCPVDRSRGASWGPDGQIVFASTPNSGLSRISASGGEPEPLTTLDEKAGESSHRWPQVLPGGKQVLFTSLGGTDFGTGRIEVLDLATRQRKVLHKGGTYARHLPSGHILFFNKGTLFTLPVDAATLEARGSVTLMIEGVGGDVLEGGAQFSVSDDGTLVYDTGRDRASTTLVWADRQGKITPLWDAAQDYRFLSLSPDGSRLLAEVEVEGNRDLWVYDLKRDVPTRLTFGKGQDAFGVWSPDGQTVYFSAERDGKGGIYRRASDGSGEEEPVLEGRDVAPSSVSPDGRNLAITEIAKGSGDILILPLDGGEPRPFVAGPQFDYGATYSPDGRWIAYGSTESGNLEIYVRPAPEGRGKWQISRGGGAYPCWSRDGRAIYYRSLEGAVVSVDVETAGGDFRAGRIETLFKGPFQIQIDGSNRYAVAPDGRFIMVKRDDASDEIHEHAQVVLHWLDELRGNLAGAGASHR